MAIPIRVLPTVALLTILWSFHGVVDGSHHVVHEELQESAAAELTVLDDVFKTGFHFQPPNMAMNDPNGLMYYKGFYHLFYQYDPNHPYWGDIVWAHSVSKDMVNWEDLEPALTPSKPFDIQGCWSGSATILPGDKPVVLYTGVNAQGEQVQNVAFPKNLSDPYLREWIKPDYNPVISPVNGINDTEFRDPTTAWLGPDRHWRMLVGTIRRNRGMAMLYRSKDFIHWTRAKHPLHSVTPSPMFECPDFFPVAKEGNSGVDTSEYGNGYKFVLKISLDKTSVDYYTIGSYCRELDKYVPDGTSPDNINGLRLDYGNFYASKTFFDPANKRRILIGWSNESDSRSDDIRKGWAGITSIPRALWLDANGRQLVQWPVEELETLRGNLVIVHNKNLKSGGHIEVSGITAAQADVEVEFQLPDLTKAELLNTTWTDPQKLCEEKGADVNGGVGPFGLLALASAKREERTAVFFRIFKTSTSTHVALMCHDASRSSLKGSLYRPTYGGFVRVDIKNKGKISLRSLIDHSVVESFGAGGRTCITSRVYPTLATGDAAHLFVFNNGAEDVGISDLKAWDMKTAAMKVL